MPHVFDRFRQADSSYTRLGAGLGLGLAIVRSVVELHGGSVEAASAGEGQGATFSMTLPVAGVPSQLEAEIRPDEGDERDRLDGVHVLVVDDLADERELLQTILVARGAVVDTAESAEAALAKIARTPPMVLISDIAMPEEDGYALLRRVRTLSGPIRNLPTIAVTAHARSDDRSRALSAGFQAYISKPIDHARLARVVRELARPAVGT